MEAIFCSTFSTLKENINHINDCENNRTHIDCTNSDFLENKIYLARQLRITQQSIAGDIIQIRMNEGEAVRFARSILALFDTK